MVADEVFESEFFELLLAALLLALPERDVDDDEEACVDVVALLRDVEPLLVVAAEVLLRELDEVEDDELADLTSPERCVEDAVDD